MHHPFAFRGLRLAVAGTAACAAFGFTGAGAQASNLATCTFQTHVTRSGSTFSSNGAGDANCTGLIDGFPTAPDGAFTAQGSYSDSSCSGGSWNGRFGARLPRMLSFFESQYAQLLGSVQITQLGHALLVSGSGTLDGHPVSYGGTGSFNPDAGQACSGTLVETVAIMDGGGATSTPAAVSSHSAHRHRHHHRHSRRHK